MRKNRFTALAAVILAAAVLGACQSAGEAVKAPQSQTDGEAGMTSESQDMAEEDAASENFMVLWITADPEHGEDAALQGVSRFAGEYGYDGVEQKMDVSEGDSRYELAVFQGDDHLAEALDMARENPQARVLLLFEEAYRELNGEILPENFYGLGFKEEEAGFLAGYAAVSDGAVNLGYIGSRGSDADVRYGTGFVQGADAAALEREREIVIRYGYTDEESRESGAGAEGRTGTGNGADEKNRTAALASSWFQSGTQTIFTGTGADISAVIQATSETGGHVIQNGGGSVIGSDSQAVLASVHIFEEEMVYQHLKDMENGTVLGGQMSRYGISENALEIDFSNARFRDFSEADYRYVCEGLAAGDYAFSSGYGKDGKRMELSDLALTNSEIRTVE